MYLRSHTFEIKKDKLAKGRGLLERLKGHVSTGLQGRSHPLLPEPLQQLGSKIGLSQRLTSAERHTAFGAPAHVLGHHPLHQGPGVKLFTDPAQRAGAAGPGTGKAAPAGGAVHLNPAACRHGGGPGGARSRAGPAADAFGRAAAQLRLRML